MTSPASLLCESDTEIIRLSGWPGYDFGRCDPLAPRRSLAYANNCRGPICLISSLFGRDECPMRRVELVQRRAPYLPGRQNDAIDIPNFCGAGLCLGVCLRTGRRG